MTQVSETDRKWHEMREAAEKEAVGTILAASLGLESLATVATYTLPERLIVAPDGELGHRLSILQVRVTSTRFLGPPEDGENNSTPYLQAEGYGRPATVKDMPTERAYDTWHTLPVALVAPLLGRAFTA